MPAHGAHLPELLNRLAWRLQEGWGQISLVRQFRPAGTGWIRHECVKCSSVRLQQTLSKGQSKGPIARAEGSKVAADD